MQTTNQNGQLVTTDTPELTPAEYAAAMAALRETYPAIAEVAAGLSRRDRYYVVTFGGDWPEDH